MKHPVLLLFAFIAVTMLLTLGSVLNSACKSGPHGWCAPAPKIRQAATRGPESERLIGHSAARTPSSSGR